MTTKREDERADARIETVLAALQDIGPAPGMQQRIAAAVLLEREQRGSAPPLSSWWTGLPQLACAAALLLLFGVVSVHTFRRHAAFHKQQRAGVSIDRTGTSAHAMQRTGNREAAARDPAAQTARETGISVRPSSHRTHIVKPLPLMAEIQHERNEPAVQSSFPAPPLPLTEQERLLIRLVHRDDPVQLAQMIPAAREAALRRDREEVREFFRPPPMPPANFKLEPYPVPGENK